MWPNSASRRETGGRLRCELLDLADEVERRGESLLAGRPPGRADFTRVFSDVLRGLDLAQQFPGIAADAQVVDFRDLDLAFRIHDERAAQGEPLFLDQDAEVAADLVRG